MKSPARYKTPVTCYRHFPYVKAIELPHLVKAYAELSVDEITIAYAKLDGMNYPVYSVSVRMRGDGSDIVPKFG